MSDHRDPSGTQPRADYIPTLGEYAEIIYWLVAHPNEEIPKEMRRVFDDAIDRAELRHFAESLTHAVEDDARAADWQMRYYDEAVEREELIDLCRRQLHLATREDAELLVKNGWKPAT
jgi:hypothetical protein